VKYNQFVNILKDNGFTISEIFTVLGYFVTNLEAVKVEQFKVVIPVFKRAVKQIKEQEELYFEEIYGDTKGD
jgi:hypothetical protein